MFTFALEKPKTSDKFSKIELWDLIVIGGGPAGLNAALYAKRKGLEVGIVTNDIGGQLHNTSIVDNYLGIKETTGSDLSKNFQEHLSNLEVPILNSVYVDNIEPNEDHFSLNISDGRKIKTKTVLIATGGQSRKLDIPGELEYANKGVSYCTTCDAPFFQGKHVIVAGGGNSAAEAVLDLVPWASKITVVHRSQFRADKIILDKFKSIDKLSVHLNTTIKKIIGDSQMTGVEVVNKETNKTEVISADGIFIEIGTIPNSKLASPLVSLNEINEIIVDENQMSTFPGIFAAGDVTNKKEKQIIIAAAQGAKAALAITKYINNL